MSWEEAEERRYWARRDEEYIPNRNRPPQRKRELAANA